MTKTTLLFIVIGIVMPQFIFSQIYGNTISTGYGAYGQNTILWLKIETGPSDGGEFTHFGLYNHPTSGSDCDIKFAIYSDHATSDRPENLLVTAYDPNPTNGGYNELAIDNPLSLAPSTIYWIALRTNCTYGGGRIVGETWPLQPLKYYDSWSFFSSWPDPVNASSLSTYGAVNHVTWWLVANNTTLPAELISFDIKNIKNNAMLEWETASEINNLGWNIQRSENGFSWHTIGFVAGNESSNEIRSYQYEDHYDKGGMIFYRLEQMDLDGKKTYSDVKSMLYSSENLYLYPSHANAYINIGGLVEELDYKITNIAGNIEDQGTAIPKTSIDVLNLSSGIYFILLGTDVFKFVKI